MSIDDLHRDDDVNMSVLITIYLSDESVHEQVEAAVEDFLAYIGGHIEHRYDPVFGSWFRRMWASMGKAVHSPVAREAVIVGVSIAELHLRRAPEAAVTAKLMENLGPVLAALQPTKDAVIRVGALLIVKNDRGVAVHQLTAEQQLKLDDQPQLSQSPQDVLAALELRDTLEPPGIREYDSGISDVDEVLTNDELGYYQPGFSQDSVTGPSADTPAESEVGKGRDERWICMLS